MEKMGSLIDSLVNRIEVVSFEEYKKRKKAEEKIEFNSRLTDRLTTCSFSVSRAKKVTFNEDQTACVETALAPLIARREELKDDFYDFENPRERHDRIMYKLDISLPYLYGVNGCGKTAISQRVAIFCAEEYDVDFLFVKATQIASECLDTYCLGRYKGTGVLFIDDIFVHRITPAIFDALFSILDHRYENGLPVMMTSNLSPKGIIKKLLEVSSSEISEGMVRAIVDRVLGLCYPLELKGKSFRIKKTLEIVEREIHEKRY